jgi:hypothetical protein
MNIENRQPRKRLRDETKPRLLGSLHHRYTWREAS